ncbi:MAG: hypothetical protein KC731_20000 [Myxococcales bacterium]|nr:hypothetical protein [Myxococcales bacterium]
MPISPPMPRVLLVQACDRVSFAAIGELLDPLDVDIANTEAEVLATITNDACDVLLVDQVLDDGTPHDLLRHLRKAGSLLPAIAWADDHEQIARLLDAGANDFVDPVGTPQLRQLIAASTPLPAEPPSPSPTKLALTFATAFALPDASRRQAEATLTDLLFGTKQAWAAFATQIITHTELRNLLLAHILHPPLIPPNPSATRNAFTRDFELALFPR